MTISTELFKAILAMDSYNRGYDEGITGLSDANGQRIGTATIVGNANDPNGAAQAASFYAVAYELDAGVHPGEKVISYRGTDEFAIDPFNGWSVGIFGASMAEQAQLAQEFTTQFPAAEWRLMPQPGTQNL